MKSSGILGSILAVRSSLWPSSTVVPLPSPRSPLENKCSHDNGVNATRLLQNVTDFIRSQRNIVEIISSAHDADPGFCNGMRVEEWLDDGVELLDACGYLLEKLGFVRKYAESVQMAVHLVKPGMAPVAMTRVREILDKKSCDVDMSGTRLKRVVSRLVKRRRGEEGCDVLTGLTLDAVDTCRGLDRAVSFTLGRGSSEQMVELREAVRWAKRLRDLTAEKDGEVDRSCLKTVRDTCQVLIERVGPLEERVRELYRQLMWARVTLLGITSHREYQPSSFVN